MMLFLGYSEWKKGEWVFGIRDARCVSRGTSVDDRLKCIKTNSIG
jgi:hypothetical protein